MIATPTNRRPAASVPKQATPSQAFWHAASRPQADALEIQRLAYIVGVKPATLMRAIAMGVVHG